MIYIYNDFAGTHSTALAAAYHLKKLPTNRKPTKEEILQVDYFNKLTPADFGKIIFHGIDEDGNAVYTPGRKRATFTVLALRDLSEILQETFQGKEKIIFSNTSPTVPIAMTFGGLFSRRLKIDFIGVPLLILGAKQSCQDILRLVEYTKQSGKFADSLVTILDNQKGMNRRKS